jgi:beta-glucosidase
LTRPPRGGDDKYVSRYIDERNAPLFPFGYGLSYTRFEYSTPQLSATSATLADLDKAPISVTIQVRNTGARAGTEVVQLYIGQRGTSVARPVRELKGFERVRLEPGESRALTFSITRDTLAFWSLDKGWRPEPAEVSVWVAPHAAAGTPARFTVW